MAELMILTQPEIAAEWHPTKNGGVNIADIKENSSLKVWWQCSIDPKHEWQARVRNRCVDGNRCPYCYGHKKVHPEKSLAALFPDIAAELHPTKNGILTAENLHPHSNKKVWWQCKKNPSHEWYAEVATRVRYNTSCRECDRVAASLAAKYPDVAKEWHPTKNLPLLPTSVMPKSEKSVWWQCLNNPNHQWQCSVRTRTVHGNGCPSCRKSGQKRLLTLDIYSPELAAQWHPTRNDPLKPSDVTVGNQIKAWWVCPVDSTHE
ncbi:MAG: zinc-ribbon domain-containing protein [Dehalococcoidia bacterium]